MNGYTNHEIPVSTFDEHELVLMMFHNLVLTVGPLASRWSLALQFEKLEVEVKY